MVIMTTTKEIIMISTMIIMMLGDGAIAQHHDCHCANHDHFHRRGHDHHDHLHDHDHHYQDGEGSSALHVVTEGLQEATEEETQNLVGVVLIHHDSNDHDFLRLIFICFVKIIFSHYNLLYQPGRVPGVVTSAAWH